MKHFYYVNNSLMYVENNSNEGDVYDYDDISKAFAKSLKEMRLFYKLSGNMLALLLNIPQQTLNLYENNKRTPSFVTALQIAGAFGVSIETMVLNGLGLLEVDIEALCQPPVPRD